MKEPIWALPEIVASVHQMLFAEHGGSPGVRDQGLLDSALSRPRQRFSYSEDHTIFDLAAAYAYALAGNHPFIDGNKRASLTIAAIFLEMNGYSLDASEAEAVVMFEQLAAGSLSEEDLSTWFRNSPIR